VIRLGLLLLALQTIEPDSVQVHRGTVLTARVTLPKAGNYLLQLRERITGSPLRDRLAIVVDSLPPSVSPLPTTFLIFQAITVSGMGTLRFTTPRVFTTGAYEFTLSDSTGAIVGLGSFTVRRTP
jgi:hypothetical protein